jgi:hypothetical protein
MISETRTAGRDDPAVTQNTLGNQFGQQRLRSGPTWYPGGQALPSNIGWHLPPGPRHQPGPQPSATLIIELLAAPAGASITAAFAGFARPIASAAPTKIVRIILYLPLIEQGAMIYRTGRKIGSDGSNRLVKGR